MSNNSHKRIVKKLIYQKLEKSICKNDFQRAVFKLAKKKSHTTKMEFWVFFSGIDTCLELTDDELSKLKEIKNRV